MSETAGSKGDSPARPAEAGPDAQRPGDADRPADAERRAAPAPDGARAGPLAEREWPRSDERTAIRTASAPLPIWLAGDQQFEAFRELRTRLVSMGESAHHEHFTTMIVPMTATCGGSFVSRNLAAAFTLQRRPSLVIECNLRGSADDEGFGPGGDAHGLFEFLSDSDDPSAVLPIWPTVIKGLNVIPAGRRDPANAALHREHLSSPAMKDLMNRVRSWPCNTFLDAPPFEGSPDARILSEFADYVVLVVGYARATTRAIAKAAATFDKKKFVGAVFNEAAAAPPPRRR